MGYGGKLGDPIIIGLRLGSDDRTVFANKAGLGAYSEQRDQAEDYVLVLKTTRLRNTLLAGNSPHDDHHALERSSRRRREQAAAFLNELAAALEAPQIWLE